MEKEKASLFEAEFLNADAIVVGGSIGGVMAAYALALSGVYVILTEETDWIGGQFTSQAVPSDEHAEIERQGCTETYRQFRNNLRQYYQCLPELKESYRNVTNFNPGAALVSNISAEPRVILQLLNDMLKPFVNSGKLRILYNTYPVGATMSGNEIVSIKVRNNLREFVLKGKYFLDATDCGDLLPIVGAEYRTGAESKAETLELHALDVADPQDMQPITHCAAIDYRPEQDEASTERPHEYEFFLKKLLPCDSRHGILSYYAPNLNDRKSRRFAMFENELFEGEKYFPLFPYRQVVKSDYFKKGFHPYDITLVNWPQTDYFLGNVFDCVDAECHRYLAKQLTLSVVHWFNTEAETPSGKKGYRGFNLRGDVLGTGDGLAKSPYIRESRRIVAKKTITENMICKQLNASYPIFHDSVGVGSYHIDVHMTTSTRSFFFYEVQPFEIPLSSLIPVRLTNLIASCKNIGTTHLTNGCYRLHPIEWNIGEAAGFLVSFCIRNKVVPNEVCDNSKLLKEYQELLIENGIQLHWNSKKG